jgi:exodeoxyribonuclease-5
MDEQLSQKQGEAVRAVLEWFRTPTKDRKPIFRLFGFAGTGKTYTAKHIEQEIGGNVAYMAFTGKAALVMRENGCRGASTIHSQIYKVVRVKSDDGKSWKHKFVLNHNSPIAMSDLIIVDECSMVGEKIANDLMSFGIPILVLGDPAQLPPIDGLGYFTEAEPDIMLTEIHRQAKDSPIVWMATQVRRGRTLKYGKYGDSEVVSKVGAADMNEYDQIIVGRHVTRNKVNSRVRKSRGFDDDLPMKGEKLLCLKNDSSLGIYNGSLLEVERRIEINYGKMAGMGFHKYDLTYDLMEGDLIEAIVHDSFFDGSSAPHKSALDGTQHMDYGYSLTGHKSQGSQWGSVLIFDESYCFRESASRWLYTTITRAEHTVKIYRS